jgi:hypothetical protein
MIMELQPYGPVEQAIQNSGIESPKPKTSGSVIWGIVLTLTAAIIGWKIISHRKDKKYD